MLTRIEINGFKSFHHFAIDLYPFQVFIGPNGVGKSNLFEAIRLLSDLADNMAIPEAFQHSRGEPEELFTLYPDGTRAKVIDIAVEMLIDRAVMDENGKKHEIGSTRLRYELGLESRGQEGHVHVVREGLIPIKDADDLWVKDMIPSKVRKAWIIRDKRPPYIATVGEEGGKTMLYRNQDGIAGGRESAAVGNIERTMLGSAHSARFPTIHAAREEMRSWRFLQLNPAILRQPAGKQSKTSLLSDGSNLAAVLSRLSRDHGLSAVLKDMRALIPSIADLTVTPMPERGDYLIEIETQDKSKFSSRVLSDGTLRLLTLVTLKNDPQHRGVLCFEEPENGVQPLRLKQTVDVLYALITDLNKEGSPNGLRQVLVNTHSPGLLSNVPADSLFYVHMKTQEKGRVTQVVPVRPELIADEQERYYTWEQVTLFLDADSLNKKREELGL